MGPGAKPWAVVVVSPDAFFRGLGAFFGFRYVICININIDIILTYRTTVTKPYTETDGTSMEESADEDGV